MAALIFIPRFENLKFLSGPKAAFAYSSRLTTKLAAPRNGGFSSSDSIPDKRSAVHSQKERMPALAIRLTSTLAEPLGFKVFGSLETSENLPPSSRVKFQNTFLLR